jgi:hypothetical protein
VTTALLGPPVSDSLEDLERGDFVEGKVKGE